MTAMDITLVRVDNRLVHGQILEAWLPFTHSSCIIVADDEVAGDFFRETVIRMAVPREVEVIVCSVEDCARNYSHMPGQGKKAIVLFSTVADACRAFKAGFTFRRLNLGNVHHDRNDAEKIRYSSCVFLDNDDITCIRTLIDTAGVQVELRRIPQEDPVDVQDVMLHPEKRDQ